jgi:uncharacterized protein (TIGR03437 family)
MKGMRNLPSARGFLLFMVRHCFIGIAVFMLCWIPASAQSYLISTVAGNGTQGFSGDSADPKAAQLSWPGRVAIDSSGKLYIADGGNHRIRLVSGTTITTFAGNGTAGFAGDNAAAASAQLNNPCGVAVDSAGNVYIADSTNNVVRKVTAGGTISTFAGNNPTGAGYAGDTAAATSALLNNPVAVAVDAAGNVYIADANNNVIRKVAGGNISTVVGGAATYTQLNHPDGLAVDAAGNIYIADTVGRRLLKFSNGTVTVLAGDGNIGFGGDNGPATKASLYDPMGVAVDAAGNVYIADTFNGRIRKISTNGNIATIAGTRFFAYTGDGGPALNASLFFPHDVAVDSSGNVFISDTFNHAIRKLTIAAVTTNITSVVNAASFLPRVSPGALATVFGTGFASAASSATAPLPMSLAGVSVSVNGRTAPVLSAGPTQVNFQIPWETTVGDASVVVSVDGHDSNAFTVPILSAAPGIFYQASGRALVQNSDQTLNAAGNPARSGSTIVAYLTGSGPLNAVVVDGAAAPADSLVSAMSECQATVGSAAARVAFAGLAPGFVGLVQMNIVVPEGLGAGDYPLTVTIRGEASNSGAISVQ